MHLSYDFALAKKTFQQPAPSVGDYTLLLLRSNLPAPNQNLALANGNFR
jgi:hypothetical protein